ncbi:hypothetical protein E2C01_036384 [Portunus trituberculatus]|uniref:Uncharacterized protein n=1 Tax=Portunus trituberculatus TaxID=210409 RepID=A0A5B7FCA9_PORTR|nr:hypothetical protein [Portunus trituberculatus]
MAKGKDVVVEVSMAKGKDVVVVDKRERRDGGEHGKRERRGGGEHGKRKDVVVVEVSMAKSTEV